MQNSITEECLKMSCPQIANYWRRFFVTRKKDQHDFIPENMLTILFILKSFMHFQYGYHSPTFEVVQNILEKLIELRCDMGNIDSFETMFLRPKLLSGVLDYGFVKPSKVQRLSIFPLSIGMNAMIQAYSGTGKTATYCVAIAQQIDYTLNDLQAIVLLPTRDLSRSVNCVIQSLGNRLALNSSACVKNEKSIQDSIDTKNGFPQVIFGTPRLVLDLVRSSVINTENVKILIIDEIEELVGYAGYSDCVCEIFFDIQQQQRDVQVGIFHCSSHLTANSQALVEILKRDKSFIEIDTSEPSITLEGCKQFYIDCEKDEWKFDTLSDVYDSFLITSSIIYCNTRRKAEWLNEKLREKDFSTACVFGTMEKEERDAIISDFYQGRFRILIATDSSALYSRIPQSCGVIIHFDLCLNIENYLHRVGRSGAYGRKSVSIILATKTDLGRLHEIEKFYYTIIQELPENLNDLL